MSILSSTRITDENAWNGSTHESITSLTVPSGTNLLAVLFVGDDRPFTADFGGVSLVAGASRSDGNQAKSFCFTLSGPTVGTDALRITWPSHASNIEGYAFCLSESSIRLSQGANAFTSTSTNTLTTESGDTVLGITSYVSATAVSDAAQTDLIDDFEWKTSHFVSVSHSTASSTSTDHNYTLTPAARWTSVALAAYSTPTSETATTGNIPLTIQAGYTLVDLVDPVTTNASLLFGFTGDAPVTGDHLEYDITSVLDSGVTLSVAANGVWTVTEAVDGDWVTDITVSRRVVQADGTIGAEAVVTLSAPTSATSGLTIVTDMVSNIVSNMVN